MCESTEKKIFVRTRDIYLNHIILNKIPPWRKVIGFMYYAGTRTKERQAVVQKKMERTDRVRQWFVMRDTCRVVNFPSFLHQHLAANFGLS